MGRGGRPAGPGGLRRAGGGERLPRRDVPGVEGEGDATVWGVSDEAVGAGGVGEDSIRRLEMLVTATQIHQWADTREAQGSLPVLVRMLIQATGGRLVCIDFPAGDSVGQPGWDGEVKSDDQSPWVPQGQSFWELSCEAKPTQKANRDYKKRVKQTPVAVRSKSTFVFVTARRWTTKKKWVQEKQNEREWKDVRAYDANDLEQWLEQAPAVALWFAETLGMTGLGVESLERHWRTWSQQSAPPISPDALFADRQNTREQLIRNLRKRLEKKITDPLTIRADSVEEAAAFVCAAVLQDEGLSTVSLVVTEPSGWRFVDANPDLKVAVAARPEVAERPTVRRDLVVIIPYASGNMAGHYRGAAAREPDTCLVLKRPRCPEFEKSLVELGLDEAEAERLAASTGRSWTVFRRHHAINPAIRRPKWLGMPQAAALSTLCLLGAWVGDKSEDQEIVSRLAGRPYEEVERDLRYLAQVDDAPVLQIGTVWKAKSQLELLDLFGERITSNELDRFFEIAYEILAAPDPALDLPEEQRYAAQTYGKVRPQSDILIEALCDTLIKLAVRGPILPSLQAIGIEGRVARLVHDLLYDADRTRWLSLSPYLQSLAEAAPEAFLRAVEHSLTRLDQSVLSLLKETSDSALFGRCWHATLLWALEILAWSPRFLTRVALVLAQLAHVEIKGNWANTPLNSLTGIFRSWFPQTAVSLDERIKVLDVLVEREPGIAFELLDKLVHINHDVAFPAARPKWRGYDIGAGHGAPHEEVFRMVSAAADRLLTLAKGNPNRVARLIEKLQVFDANRLNAVLDLAAEFTHPEVSDEAKEVVRAALRESIHWHRNYDKTPESVLSAKLKPFEELYDKLAPRDPIIRHRWLFAQGWPKLPDCVDYPEINQRLETERLKALQEIYGELGMAGIEKLASICSGEPWVGATLAKLDLPIDSLAERVINKCSDFTDRDPLSITIRGLLRSLPQPYATELIETVLQEAEKQHWSPEKTARFLTLARPEKATWDIVASCGSEVEKAYWSQVPVFWLRGGEEDPEFPLRRLLEVERPRTALQVCRFVLDRVDPRLIADILEQILHGREMNGPHLDSWDIGQAIERLEASGVIEKNRLVLLEFWAIPLLGYRDEQRARTLYATLMSDPALFCELICILYKPRHREHEEPPNEMRKAAAGIAWRILHNCRRIPGTQPDGTVDEETFFEFINEVRELCREKDRLEMCDETLGQILAYSPVGQDGIWPFEPARKILDRPDLEDMRRGFVIGTFNKRGITSRAPDEGGAQERELTAKYRSHANSLRMSHPNLAAAFDRIADSYEREGKREDFEAWLHLEGVW